jgi:hypothetical protein
VSHACSLCLCQHIDSYGSLGDNGTIPSDLDECSGHVDNTHPFYHYHTPNKVMINLPLSMTRV